MNLQQPLHGQGHPVIVQQRESSPQWSGMDASVCLNMGGVGRGGGVGVLAGVFFGVQASCMCWACHVYVCMKCHVHVSMHQGQLLCRADIVPTQQSRCEAVQVALWILLSRC